MKCLVYFAIFTLLTSVSAQDISGKWVGKAFQGAGELCTECDFELNLTQGKNISGESRTYQTNITDIRIGLSGYIDSDTIRLDENRNLIFRNKTPRTWYACIKKIRVKYHKVGNTEFLIGRATGESIEDNTPCIPAKLVFTRNLEELNYYTAVYKDSLPPVADFVSKPLPEFTPDFNKTTVNKATEIEVNHISLQIRLYDYLKIDDDTVSVYLNRDTLAKNVRISKQPFKIDFNFDTRININEILLFAENLGKIPPNTSLLEIIDGNKKYRIKIESDKQKTAAIYLRYKPLKPNLNE